MVLEQLDLSIPLAAEEHQAAAEVQGHLEEQIEDLQLYLHAQKLVAHYSLEQRVDLLVEPLDQSQKEQTQMVDELLLVQLVL